MTWSLIAGPALLLASDDDNGAVTNFDGVYGLFASGDNQAYRLAYPGTLGTGATIDSLNVSIYGPWADNLDSDHVLLSWIGESGGPVDTALAIIEVGNPPTVGTASRSMGAGVGEVQVSVPLSITKALMANTMDIALYDLNVATNAVTINGSTTNHGLTNDVRAIGKLDSNDGIVVGNANPGEAIVCQTGGGSLSLGAIQNLSTGINATAAYLAPIDSTHILMSYQALPVTAYSLVVLTVSGTTVTDNTAITITGATGTPRLVRIGTSNIYGLVYPTAGGIKFRTVTVSGVTVTDNNDEIDVASSSYAVKSIAYYSGSDNIYVILNLTPNDTYYAIISQAGANARFYFAPAGQALAEKFTLPFPGVQPGGMTLDRTLGTVVIGSDAPSNEPVVYSTYPYTTGSATYDSFPTGAAIYSLKWI